MLFNSFQFLIFFCVVFGVYWSILPQKRWMLLLASSYYFYASWKPAFAILLLFSSSVTYWCARQMARAPHHKTRYLWVSILANLGMLFYFKYAGFFLVTTQQLLAQADIQVWLPTFQVLLPVGISFFTFQAVGYILDVYHQKINPETNFFRFALFLSFFPQLVAGPIERSDTLLPQLKNEPRFNYEQAATGAKLFTFGLFKKIVLADNLAIVVDRVFGNLPEYKGLSLVLAVVFFSWQIYFDFSGYTDMARGVAKLLGFELSQNFNRPYRAQNLQEFWRRWHMSLSNWLKDYLYFQLGGSRGALIKTARNYLIVFTLCGLWHGAAMTFVVWGFFHGVVLVLEKSLSAVFSRIRGIIGVIYTYGIVSVGWILFRAESLTDAAYIFRNILTGVKFFVSPSYVWATLNQVFITNRFEMLLTLSCIASGVQAERKILRINSYAI